MKKRKLILIGLVLQGTLASAQYSLNDKLALNGYMDMLLMAGDIQPLGDFVYLTTHRVNLMPQFTITPKLKATVLLEGADLFRLDQPQTEDKPGIVEWAYLTYFHNPFLNIRAGTFAIPFGIYNERFYATPTHLTSFLPLAYSRHGYGLGEAQFSSFLFPRNGSGVMVFGKILQHQKHHLNYNLYYTNETPGATIGLGKYVGGRILYETAASELLKVGASYNVYRQDNTVTSKVLGFDAQVNLKNLQLSAEMVLPRISWRDSLQMPVEGQFFEIMSSYAQAGYTIKDIVTPYFRYDVYRTTHDVENGDRNAIVGGINVAVHTQVVVKSEAYITQYDDPNRTDSELFITTLAVAF